jgi:signal transduction histidine kinase
MVLALAAGLAMLLAALPGLPHAPAFVFFLPIALAALAGSLRGALAITGLALLAYVALETLHPAGQGLSAGVLLRSVALLCVGALVSGLGLMVRRTRARWQASLEAYKQSVALHQRTEERLRSLLAREHTAEERERHRIARELHDDLQQRLAAVSLELAALRQQMPRDGGPIEDGLKRATTMAVDAIVATRRIISGLRPRVLDELGLGAALQQLGKDFATRTGVSCEVQVQEAPEAAQAMTPVEANCLFGVAQEALQNVHKHALARAVTMRLSAQRPGQYELEIVDDGVGLSRDALNKPASLGLLGMQERTRELGGSLEVANTEGGGTRVRANLRRLERAGAPARTNGSLEGDDFHGQQQTGT